MTTVDQSGKVEAGAAAQTDPFDSLWRFFSSTKLAIVLILVIAFFSFLGALIAQVPSSVAVDPDAYRQWLTAMRGQYGGLADVYNALGFFNLYQTFWFKILLLLLVFNTIICTLNRLPTLWSSIRSPRVRVNDTMFRNAPIRASIKSKDSGGKKGSSRSPQEVFDAAADVLSQHHYKVYLEEEGSTTHFYADRFGIFKLGTVISHLSLVILMVGAIMGGMFGYVDDGVIIPEGSIYKVPPQAGNFLVRADKFQADFFPDGSPKDYYSDLVVIDGGQEVAKKTIRVNDPLEYKGVRFHQAFYGPAPLIDVKDSKGTTLFSAALPLTQGNDTVSQGFQDLPNGATLVAQLPRTGTTPPSLTVQFFTGQTGVTRDSVRPGETKTIGDYQVTYRQLKNFTGLRVVKDPGVPLVWIACTLLVLGICLTLYFPRRRIWGKVTPQEFVMAGTAERTVNFRPEFDKLVEMIRKS